MMNFDSWMEDRINGDYGPELDRLEAELRQEMSHGRPREDEYGPELEIEIEDEPEDDDVYESGEDYHDGQPSEYDEWQDYYGGDEYQHGTYGDY